MRQLNTETLDGAAKHYAGEWMRPDRKSRSGNLIGGRSYVLRDFYNHTFKDEHEYLVVAIKDWLGGKALVEFEAAAKEHFTPRSDEVFADLLRQKLAIDPWGVHAEGVIGTTNLGSRVVGYQPKIVQTRRGPVTLVKQVYWPIYAGETEERIAGRIRNEIGVGPGADPLPAGTPGMPIGANVTNISAEACIAALDAVGGRLDEGSTAATIRGRTGAMPADPDATETGTLLFTCTMSDPSMLGAADDTDGTCSNTADTIADDTSADATNTLAYCRMGATGTGVDDHVDGNAGVADEAFIFNTVSIVSGATVSVTSCVIGMSQGSTAT